MDSNTEIPWFLKSNKPVLFPSHEAFTVSRDEFKVFLANELRGKATLPTVKDAKDEQPATPHPFMDGLHQHKEHQLTEAFGPDPYNKMFTENGDIAYKSSNDKLVDLFYELEDSITGERLVHALKDAWGVDPTTSLKIIFNARSIHLGKSTRKTFYRAAGWLAQNHPLTLVANLEWLYRPVIEKKAPKTEGAADEDDMVTVESEPDENDPAKHDVQHGVSHGYWKDLLNILAIAANGKLTGKSNPSDVLNIEKSVNRTRNQKNRKNMRKVASGMRQLHISNKNLTPEACAAKLRRECRQDRHAAAIAMFKRDPVYRTLHLTVARLFAEQLQKDIAALHGQDAKAKGAISLCAKWAPSDDLFHDKHTFIVSSIAELMHPRDSLDNSPVSHEYVLQPTDDREIYLRCAREMYRRDVSQLRKHLQVVERDITAQTYEQIAYNRVPSLAMNRYKGKFATHDTDRFTSYLKDVALGKKSISGATLLPSTLIKQMRCTRPTYVGHLDREVLNSQWKTLVQRVKDSGTMSSAIAVCDVSGSMTNRISQDGTQAMDASIGLSLLVAEVTAPPFGGSFITFDSHPEVMKLDMNTTLDEKFRYTKAAPWGGSTNFVAVFEDLILPMAVENKLKQEDMVKRVFVFSDMQFNSASCGGFAGWTSSYERIKEAFQNAGYEMPELVFWNLCGTRGNVDIGLRPGRTDASAKPVTAADVGTMLVSGYSQGMLKAFMDGESLDESDAEDGDAVVVGGRPKKQMDSIALVKKATGHKAYDMLQVYD